MKFAKRVFQIAAVWGVLVITPLFFLEEQIGRDQPPAITHPEFFYGFAAVTLAWQICFFVISLDPVRYRLLMIPAMLEKFPIVVIYGLLWQQGRIATSTFAMGSVDLIFGILFLIAFLRTAKSVVHDTDAHHGQSLERQHLPQEV